MAIRLIVGPPGSGKTFLMVSLLLEEYKQKKPMIFANMAGLKCPEYAYVEAAADFEDIATGLVLLDEVGVFFGSRNWQKRTERQVMSFAQVRKDGLDLWCTTQHENRVDTILRENASEYIRCRRVGPAIIGEVIDPHAETPKERRIGRKYAVLRSSVWELYDTYEKINETGGSAGSGPNDKVLRLSTVAQRRYDAGQRRKASQERQRQMRESIFVPGERSLQLTEEAKRIRTWLNDEYFALPHEASVPLEEVQKELSRRRWLARWGLSPSDAPMSCTRNSPWLKGEDPESVEERNSRRSLEENALALVHAAEVQQQKRQARASVRTA